MSEAVNPVLTSAYHVQKTASHATVNYHIMTSAANKLLPIFSNSRPQKWQQVPLHPTLSHNTPEQLIDYIFVLSLLNFSFWSEEAEDRRYAVEWRTGCDGKGEGWKKWMGYYSLLAALNRAREEGIEITTPGFYATASEQQLKHVFRSCKEEQIPLLDERIRLLHESGKTLLEKWQGSFVNVLKAANGSALDLIELVIREFPAFRDECDYRGQTVFIRKRAQILVAELWAAFDGQAPCNFHDISKITMFADYRVPQILHTLGLISYSDELVKTLEEGKMLDYGDEREVEIRTASIVAVAELGRAIAKDWKEGQPPNAIQLDFYLWDAAKEMERAYRQEGRKLIPCHRTRSIYY